VTYNSIFFKFPIDDIERAAVLLHGQPEHLQGSGELRAYEAAGEVATRLDARRLCERYLPQRFKLDQTSRARTFRLRRNFQNDCTE